MPTTALLARRTVLTAGAAGLATAAVAAASPASSTPLDAPFGPVTLYTPAASDPAPGCLYARAVRLSGAGPHRPLLATFEQYVTGEPVFPIFRSDDDGRSWRRWSTVHDTRNGWGLRYQPFLYRLPAPFAGLPAGALLCAGNSIPDDLSRTKIDLYASLDTGRTWHYRSSVASGGRAVPNNGETPVWEPFLLLRHGRLICYFSDQRDPRYGQKLAHRVTTDLVHWGPVVDDVTSPDYSQRPGMTTVAPLPDGRWIMTYEGGGDSGSNFFAVHFRIARDPERFLQAAPHLLADEAGTVPSSSPTVSWSNAGGRNGTIVVSANSDADLFVNRALGAGAWQRVPSHVPAGYTRFTVPLERGLVFTVSGGTIGNSGHNRVQDGVDRVA